MSVSLHYDLSDLARLGARVDRLAGLDTRGLMDALGAEGESQTKRRIKDEKTGPDGVPWPAWSAAYAATRHAGHSLLMASGHMHDSIQYLVGLAGDFVHWGSNLVQARPHQEGMDISILSTHRHIKIPPRPYLGFSAENLADLGAVLDDWVDAQLEAL